MIATGIKKILYADVSAITADLTAALAKTLIQGAITAKAEVTNVHGETWQIEESESTVNGFKNQLNGQVYRHDTSMGDITPSFSIGQYDYATKAALLGGTVITKGGEGLDATDPIGWKRATGKVVIKKALMCLTDDDVWFIYPNTQVVARESNTDKAIALAVKALVNTPDVAGVSSEYNFDESEVQALTV